MRIRAVMALNALWSCWGLERELLSLRLTDFLSPFAWAEKQPPAPPLHRLAWRVVEEETGRFGAFNAADPGDGGHRDRILACAADDEYFGPRGRLVPQEDFEATRTDLPDLGEGGEGNRSIFEGTRAGAGGVRPRGGGEGGH